MTLREHDRDGCDSSDREELDDDIPKIGVERKRREPHSQEVHSTSESYGYQPKEEQAHAREPQIPQESHVSAEYVCNHAAADEDYKEWDCRIQSSRSELHNTGACCIVKWVVVAYRSSREYDQSG